MGFENNKIGEEYEHIKNINKKGNEYHVTLGDESVPFSKKPGQLVQEAAKEALSQLIPEYEKQKKLEIELKKQEKAKELFLLINTELKNKGIDNQIIFNSNSKYDYDLQKTIMGVYFHGSLNSSIIKSSFLNKDNLTVMTYIEKDGIDIDGLIKVNDLISKIEDLYNGYITMNDGTRRHVAIANGRIYWDPIKNSKSIMEENEAQRVELENREKEAEEYYSQIKNIEFSITEEGQRFIRSGGTFGDIKKSIFLKLYQSGKPLKATSNNHFIKGGASYIEMKEIFNWAISNNFIK
jgi:hypothetical protein